MWMPRIRGADESLLRPVGKCLHRGVLDGCEFSKPEQYAAQGSIIWPTLGNVCLHDVLDTWFEQTVTPRLGAHVRRIGYANDFVMGFRSWKDAECVLVMRSQRMAAFGLTLHPDETRLVQFGGPQRLLPHVLPVRGIGGQTQPPATEQAVVPWSLPR